MGFESLLGNQQLKSNLENSLARGHISHFYLISGPAGSGKHTLARLLAAAILCQGRDKPCLRCRACRKLLDGSHPDFITVDDPEKKTVSVELIRQARGDIFVRPNESEYKIYLFPRAQDMGLPGQNALLKVLEEPPPYGVFLLLTDNPDKLLPTVRSRCTELKLHPLPEDVLIQALAGAFPQAARQDLQAAAIRSGGYLGQARQLLEGGGEISQQTLDFVRALSRKDSLLLAQTLIPMEKWKRDALLEQLGAWLALGQSALACRSGLPPLSAPARELAQGCTGPELWNLCQQLKKARDYAAANVSPGAVCGYLTWNLL